MRKLNDLTGYSRTEAALDVLPLVYNALESEHAVVSCQTLAHWRVIRFIDVFIGTRTRTWCCSTFVRYY